MKGLPEGFHTQVTLLKLNKDKKRAYRSWKRSSKFSEQQEQIGTEPFRIALYSGARQSVVSSVIKSVTKCLIVSGKKMVGAPAEVMLGIPGKGTYGKRL